MNANGGLFSNLSSVISSGNNRPSDNSPFRNFNPTNSLLTSTSNNKFNYDTINNKYIVIFQGTEPIIIVNYENPLLISDNCYFISTSMEGILSMSFIDNKIKITVHNSFGIANFNFLHKDGKIYIDHTIGYDPNNIPIQRVISLNKQNILQNIEMSENSPQCSDIYRRLDRLEDQLANYEEFKKLKSEVEKP